MGGIDGVLDKLPGMGNMAQAAQQQMDVQQFARMQVMISSMTPQERRRPELIQGSRKRRITAGSGTRVQDLVNTLIQADQFIIKCRNRLLKQHRQMQKMMKKMKGGGMQKMLRGLGGAMGGGMPPGGLPPGFR